MIKKIYIQLFLIFIFLTISIFIYLEYFKKAELEIINEKKISQAINTGESLIEDLKYLSTDKEGNEYKIEAEKGNIDKNNPDIIFLENVRATILFQNSEKISIKSNYAKYNAKNFDTLFNDSVSVDYGEHILKSNFLDLSFENNLVSIYDNVRYLSGISSLRADKAEIDILNKKTKIFMDNPSKKVQISNIPENGNN